MPETISITKQWQIHIPKKLREALGLKHPGKAEIKLEKGNIIISPHKDTILKDAGRYQRYAKRRKLDLDNIRDHIDYS